jgi:hypothetical protein
MLAFSQDIRSPAESSHCYLYFTLFYCKKRNMWPDMLLVAKSDSSVQTRLSGGHRLLPTRQAEKKAV